MASVRFDNLRKEFATGAVALESLNLAVADGEFVVLLGPSGSGKTTTLRLTAGLEAPTSGRIAIGERDVTNLPPADRNVAMVSQHYALYPHQTVRGNLEFGLRMRGLAADQISARVDRVTQILGLESLLDRRPRQLSGGQRQRVALGRAIVRDPFVFLLDEPLSQLDRTLRLRARTELARMHRDLGATLLYVTHDQEEALTLGDRVAVLRDGRMEQVDTPLELFRRPNSVFVAEFVGSPAMNLFPARLVARDSQPWFEANGFAFPMPGSQPANASNEVICGVRPTDIELIPKHDETADAAAQVEAVHSLGSHQVVELKLVDVALMLTAVVGSDRHITVNDGVGIRLRRDNVHVFDRPTERRLN